MSLCRAHHGPSIALQALIQLRLELIAETIKFLAHVLHRLLQWDLAKLTLPLLLTGLISVLWLRRQRRQAAARHQSQHR